MSFALTPSKRPFEYNGHLPPNAREKPNHLQHQRKMANDSDLFRILCRAAKTGSLIGKGGSIITKIRQQTGAKVRVEESVPGCDERVVVIIGPDKDKEIVKEHNKKETENGGQNDATDDGKETGKQDECKEEKESEPLKDLKTVRDISPAQKALLLVFDRIVEGESETEAQDETNKKSNAFVVRLLVPSTQVGCILGKGGSVIKQMSSDSGAQMRILPRDKIPSCALPSEELLQITGRIDSARKALQSVSQQMLQNPHRERDAFPLSKSHPEVLSSVNYHPSQGPRHGFGLPDGSDFFPNASPSMSMFHEPTRPNAVPNSTEILGFRLLCSNEKVGGVIGKGGNIVKAIHNETGADIKILDAVQDTEDRIIAISAPVHPMDRISAAQDALLCVQSRIVKSTSDSIEKIVLARLLVPSNQIGCLLGKGGNVIAEMRKMSGAQIRILGKDQISKSASEHEEEIQITGGFEAVQEALLQITSRLRHHMFRDKALPLMHHPSHDPFSERMPPPDSYMGRQEPSPQMMYPNYVPPNDAFAAYEERPPFHHGFHRTGIPHGSEMGPPMPNWPLHGGSGGAGGGLPDYPGGVPPSRKGGFGSNPAIITNTTVEVSVPRSYIPSIYGEDGECLRQIRQISGAKITITDTRPGDTETLIVISGTPDQTHAAQSLLQAFVMSEQGSH